MNRDMRLTGSLRGQTDSPLAPFGFELNNPWRVRIFIPDDFKDRLLTSHPDGEALFLGTSGSGLYIGL